MTPTDRILVMGSGGMVGSAIVRALLSDGYFPSQSAHRDHDLTDPCAVRELLHWTRPGVVFLAAGLVGGIGANAARPADFAETNLLIAANVIPLAYRMDVKKLVYLGSSCMYQRDAAQPMREDALLAGVPEDTCRAYAVAKIAGVELCRAFRAQHGFDALALAPTNLYGPGDLFREGESHALAAFVRRFVEARRDGLASVTCWGTGTPRREFMHVDDCAAACVHFAEMDTREWAVGADPINVGTGVDATIAEVAGLVADTVGYEGEIEWDLSRPDGAPRKLLDVSLARSLGWESRISLADGVRRAVAWYRENESTARK